MIKNAIVGKMHGAYKNGIVLKFKTKDTSDMYIPIRTLLFPKLFTNIHDGYVNHILCVPRNDIKKITIYTSGFEINKKIPWHSGFETHHLDAIKINDKTFIHDKGTGEFICV